MIKTRVLYEGIAIQDKNNRSLKSIIRLLYKKIAFESAGEHRCVYDTTFESNTDDANRTYEHIGLTLFLNLSGRPLK